MSKDRINNANGNQQNKIQTNQPQQNNSMEFASDMAVELTNSQKPNQKGSTEEPVSERTAWH